MQLLMPSLILLFAITYGAVQSGLQRCTSTHALKLRSSRGICSHNSADSGAERQPLEHVSGEVVRLGQRLNARSPNQPAARRQRHRPDGTPQTVLQPSLSGWVRSVFLAAPFSGLAVNGNENQLRKVIALVAK